MNKTGEDKSGPDLDSEARRGSGANPPMRPKDAATLILIDRSGDEPMLLMGKRHTAHAFMPDTYVFPGGRRDRGDGYIPAADDLHPAVEEKLLNRMPKPASAFRARALAIAAVRETFEEVGILIGGPGPVSSRQDWSGFANRKLAPRLSPLRYIARAITPPGRTRRFDTRFFACFRDEIGRADAESSNELLDLKWVPVSQVGEVEMPRITQAIITELVSELNHDPSLPFGRPVPFYQARHGRFVRELL
ncbi:NUDIX hydrolase [Hoeflea poritis]|uniref:NUDIX domain-containing protein n=1 Tax=Hoeflea poritis TaxID=2993659 RepID=A0ABT4VQ01_9HYPH|nr:NUDIX domain-containing protein [Hoeflea poritis]MDA4846779.1 NUDIX domain-containing protein [Hoeflea poritis]